MAIATVVTRGYGNGTFDGTIALVVTRGYGIGAAVVEAPVIVLPIAARHGPFTRIRVIHSDSVHDLVPTTERIDGQVIVFAAVDDVAVTTLRAAGVVVVSGFVSDRIELRGSVFGHMMTRAEVMTYRRLQDIEDLAIMAWIRANRR